MQASAILNHLKILDQLPGVPVHELRPNSHFGGRFYLGRIQGFYQRSRILKKPGGKIFPGLGQGHGSKLRVIYEKMRITEQNINGFFINSFKNAIIFTAECRNRRGSQVNIAMNIPGKMHSQKRIANVRNRINAAPNPPGAVFFQLAVDAFEGNQPILGANAKCL